MPDAYPRDKNVSSVVTGETFTIRYEVTCVTRNAIYLKECTDVEKYSTME